VEEDTLGAFFTLGALVGDLDLSDFSGFLVERSLFFSLFLVSAFSERITFLPVVLSFLTGFFTFFFTIRLDNRSSRPLVVNLYE